MDGRFAISSPFQQYFSHIRTMASDNEMLCAMEPYLWVRGFHLLLEQDLNLGLLDQ